MNRDFVTENTDEILDRTQKLVSFAIFVEVSHREVLQTAIERSSRNFLLTNFAMFQQTSPPIFTFPQLFITLSGVYHCYNISLSIPLLCARGPQHK